MCTSPITITREFRALGVTRSFTVPCGKCAECLARKRSELAALSVMQANVSGSVFFLTLTYRNEKLPVAISDNEDDRASHHTRHKQGKKTSKEHPNADETTHDDNA